MTFGDRVGIGCTKGKFANWQLLVPCTIVASKINRY